MSTLQQYIGYDNLVTINNLAATSSQTSYPVANAANPSTSLRWRSDSTGEQYVTYTHSPSNRYIDYIGIAGHNLDKCVALVGVEYQATSGGAWSSVFTETFTEFSVFKGSPILKLFQADDSHVPYAVRIKITPQAGIKPEIGVIYVGNIMQLMCGVYVGHTPINYGRSVAEVNGMAESGDFLGRIIRQTSYESEIKLNNMSPTWYRSRFEPFVISSKTSPFFYAWRLDEYADEVGYCWVSGGVPVPVNTGPGALMGVSFKIRGIA